MIRPSVVPRIGLLVVTAALAGGCTSEEPDTGPEVIRRGEVHSTEAQISIEAEDWTYAVPLDGVQWVDQDNVWHESGRPECLAPTNQPTTVTFAAVEVTIEGSTWRPVVWIDCRQ